MDSNSIMSIAAIVVSVAGSVLAVVNHKRIRSGCCGKEVVLSVDVESTTPTKDLKIKVPVEQV
jgi:hypothetical protein